MKTKLISIGIDVGSVNGAISVTDEDGKILVLTKAPIYQTEIKSKRNKSKLNKETGKYEVIACSGNPTTIAATASTPAHSTTDCMLVVSNVNSVNLSNYLSILNADTKAPWMQGFETVSIKAGASVTSQQIANGTYTYNSNDFIPVTDVAYAKGSYIYYRIYFTEYVNITTNKYLWL